MSSHNGGDNANAVQRTSPAPVPINSKRIGPSRATTREENISSTISAMTPSAHNRPISVGS